MRLSRVLLTYKGRPSAVDNPVHAAALRKALPVDVAVSAVWSAKNAYVGTGKSARAPFDNREDATFAKFVEYSSALEIAGAASILVVSGAGGKKALDSVDTVRRAAGAAPPVLPLGVAFNPHIGGVLDPHGGEKQREAEWDRLVQKLHSGNVDQVWIAFGADVAALKSALERLEIELAQLSDGGSSSDGGDGPAAVDGGGGLPGLIFRRPAIFGSVFVPVHRTPLPLCLQMPWPQTQMAASCRRRRRS